MEKKDSRTANTNPFNNHVSKSRVPANELGPGLDAFWLSAEERRTMRQMANSEGITLVALVRKALAAYYEGQYK